MEVHWIAAISAILPMAFLQSVIHQLSHGLAMRIGWKWGFKIHPLPSKGASGVVWPHVTYRMCSKSCDLDMFGKAIASIAPKIANVVLVMASGIAITQLLNPTLLTLLLMFALANTVDFMSALSIFRKSGTSDIWRFSNYTGIETSHVRWFVAAISFLLLLLVVVSFFGRVLPQTGIL